MEFILYLRAENPTRRALSQPIAASGGVLVCLDWSAFTPAIIQIRLFYSEVQLLASSRARRRMSIRGFAASWLFSSRRQALILLENCTARFAWPNVRGKRATTACRRALAG